MYWIIVQREGDAPVSRWFMGKQGEWVPHNNPNEPRAETDTRNRWRDLTVAKAAADILQPQTPHTNTVEVWQCDEHGNMRSIDYKVPGGIK